MHNEIRSEGSGKKSRGAIAKNVLNIHILIAEH